MAWAGRTPVNSRGGPGAAAGLRRAQEVQLRLGLATGVWQYPDKGCNTESSGLRRPGMCVHGAFAFRVASPHARAFRKL